MPAVAAGRIQPFSTGATFLFLGIGNGKQKAPVCFGTCEGYPKHERRCDWMPLMNDVGGRRKPIDMSFQGYDATISLSMTVWDEGVHQMLQQFPDFTGQTGLGLPGSYRFADVGSLMGFEQFAIPLWIVYSFGGGGPFTPKLAYTGGGMPSGYHYYQCIPFPPETTEEGAQAEILHLMLYAWPLCNFQSLTHSLFDNNMSAVQSVAINGPIAA